MILLSTVCFALSACGPAIDFSAVPLATLTLDQAESLEIRTAPDPDVKALYYDYVVKYGADHQPLAWNRLYEDWRRPGENEVNTYQLSVVSPTRYGVHLSSSGGINLSWEFDHHLNLLALQDK